MIAPVTSPEPAEVTTFGKFAEDYIASVEAGWRNAVHRQQCRQSLKDHARGLTDLPIGIISTDDVLTVLRPIWLTKSETAKRIRGRIEKILDAAKARGLRPRDSMNPAIWRGHRALLLPAQSNLARGHGLAEAFVRTWKRDYARVNLKPSARTVIDQLPGWFAHYNTGHRHRALSYRSPREFIARSTQEVLSAP